MNCMSRRPKSGTGHLLLKLSDICGTQNEQGEFIQGPVGDTEIVHLFLDRDHKDAHA